MGFISKQWLNRGRGLRNRRYAPERVSVVAIPANDAWSKRNETAVELIARRYDSQFQALYLTQSEVEQAVQILANVCSPGACSRLARELLKGMTDRELLTMLAHDLKARTKN